MDSYRAEPASPARSAVILIEEIWGLVPHIEDVADRLAAEGYLVIAPDLMGAFAGLSPEAGLELHRAMSSPDEAVRASAQPALRAAFAPTGSPEFGAEAVAALKAVVDDLEAEPGIEGRIAVMGFCFGGTYSYALAAADPRIRAAVPFYGSADPATVGEIHCPVLAFYGAQDQRLIEALPEVRQAMADGGVDATIQVYPDAGHAFFNDTSAFQYRATDAADAWRRTLAFLEDALA
jgi:carboxymethylenebutenolidase